MAQSDEQDRSEPATPFKLQEARRRGQVAKSMEINSLLILSGALAVVYLQGDSMIGRALGLSRAILSQAHAIDFVVTSPVTWSAALASRVLEILSPFVITLIVVGVLSNLFQTKPVFSLFPLKPDIQRLNPVAGFKRLFSKRLLYEALKSVAKLVLLSAVLYFALARLLPALIGLLDVHPDGYAAFLLHHSKELAVKLLLVLLPVALLDLLYTRWDYHKRMRMSRREIKEEVRRREGDPHVKARIRELQREAARRSKSLRRVRNADVLVTNPTHLAVALRYERESMSAPQLIAKGAGEMAQRMRVVAVRHGVPIIENRALAKALFRQVDIDQSIPAELFPAVAKVLVWAYAMHKGTWQVDARASGASVS